MTRHAETDPRRDATALPRVAAADLRESSGLRRRQLVCLAETLTAPDEDRDDLLSALRDYITEMRDSNDREELIAVGAAIRKFVAVLPASQIGELSELLDAGHRSPLPIELELEVAKMVFRKFEAHPPAPPDPEPALAARLAEIAELYVTPRLAARENYGAVAMLAAQAIAVMGSDRWPRVARAVNGSGLGWFREQLARRLSKVVEQWKAIAPDASVDLAARITAVAGATAAA